jgi:hypothetical protein
MLVAQLGLDKMFFHGKALCLMINGFGLIQQYLIQSEHGEPPKKTCATIVSYGSDLIQLIRCVIELVALFRKE